ncbi:MAG TPA: site-specific DNA-methyltransferase [Agitococcus sp.]|nr:site-specific DNA-methyltransferase [Agitococcus sp.]
MPTLTWIGKDKVVNHHHDVPYSVLEKTETFTAPQDSPENSTKNRIIHGDNLSVLKSLLPEFEGRVNCIYIDPPYNTGNEGWVYNDNVNDPRIKKWLGEVVGKEGDDLTRHDKWLCMMYPRLKLLHRLLANDGVIFVSIDDNEQANLKLIMDEIWGAGNFVADFIWHHRKSSQNDTDVSLSHNHTFCFSKNRNIFKLKPLAVNNNTGKFSNSDNDVRGDWVADPMDAPAVRENLMYPITNPNTGEVFYPPNGRHWRFTQDKYNQALSDNRIVFGKTGQSKPQYKRFLSEAIAKGTNPFTIWSDIDTATDGTKQIMSIFEGVKIFDTPKPIGFLERVLSIATNKNSIILDSFAGSGTTAHAVLKLNAQDSGNRQFILCEMMDYANTITAERVRRVMTGYGEGTKRVEGLGGAFDYYELGEPIFIGEYLNEAVGESKIRQYVTYSENIPLEQQTHQSLVSPYLLGINDSTAWIFYYDPQHETVLTVDFLATLKYRANGYTVPTHSIIYADRCVLTTAQLQRYGIQFKKTPRDITRL